MSAEFVDRSRKSRPAGDCIQFGRHPRPGVEHFFSGNFLSFDPDTYSGPDTDAAMDCAGRNGRAVTGDNSFANFNAFVRSAQNADTYAGASSNRESIRHEGAKTVLETGAIDLQTLPIEQRKRLCASAARAFMVGKRQGRKVRRHFSDIGRDEFALTTQEVVEARLLAANRNRNAEMCSHRNSDVATARLLANRFTPSWEYLDKKPVEALKEAA